MWTLSPYSPSNVHGHRLLYLLNGLVQIVQLVALLYSLHCPWVSRFMQILLARCYLQSIVHHCISCRCSSYMIHIAGIGYIEHFQNLRRWQKVNAVGIQFCNSASGNLILCTPCNFHLSKWFFNTSSLVQPYEQY